MRPAIKLSNDARLVVADFDNDDMDKIVDVLEEAIKDTPYSDHDITKEDRQGLVSSYLMTPNESKILLLVYNKDNEVVGLLSAAVHPHTIKPDKKIAAETLWWVHKDYRTSNYGLKLYKAFELWAEKVNADYITMSNFQTTYDLSKFLTHYGFSQKETAYIRKVN